MTQAALPTASLVEQAQRSPCAYFQFVQSHNTMRPRQTQCQLASLFYPTQLPRHTANVHAVTPLARPQWG
jgi:hypothetical protein